jgi:diacylglycerol kinase family enzyme
MGADALAGLGFEARARCAASPTRGRCTRGAALAAHGIDVLMFAGGDGTARDLDEALPKGFRSSAFWRRRCIPVSSR